MLHNLFSFILSYSYHLDCRLAALRKIMTKLNKRESKMSKGHPIDIITIWKDIKGNQRSSKVNTGHQRSLQIIKGHYNISKVITGHQSSSKTIKMWHQNVSSKCLIKIFYQNVSSECFIQMWYHFIKISHHNVSLKCPIKMLYQIFHHYLQSKFLI